MEIQLNIRLIGWSSVNNSYWHRFCISVLDVNKYRYILYPTEQFRHFYGVWPYFRLIVGLKSLRTIFAKERGFNEYKFCAQ